MIKICDGPFACVESPYDRTACDGRFGLVTCNARDGHCGLEMACCELLAGLTSQESTQVLANARTKSYLRGDLLCLDGEAVREVFLLAEGVVKIMKFARNGDAVIFGLGLSGDIISPANLISDCKYSTTVQSLRTSRALVWSVPDFKTMVESCPLLHKNYLRIQHGRLLEIEERFFEMATKTVSQRLARQLVRLHGRVGRLANGMAEISVSREELAQMTGTTVFSACRMLVDWENRGLVRSRREAVTVCDPESLRALSE
jgi:CRP-like cAMP-binding protein